MGTINANQIVKLFGEMQDMPQERVRDCLTMAVVKTGLFKRRIIHVARRFGALKKWADFSSVSLQTLVKSFEGTSIYEEALKEVFFKDLDIERLVYVLEMMQEEEIRVHEVKTNGNPTPIARVGIERMSMKTDLIPPERMRVILTESVKVRLLNETNSLLCTNCWNYVEMKKPQDLPDNPKCPRCGSLALGLLKVEEEKAWPIMEKKGERLTRNEERLRRQALRTARLVKKHGKAAIIALSARRVKPSDIEGILEKEHRLSDNFYQHVLEAERKVMTRRFWK
jgi:ATP-dependent Lhr-like helicase